MFKEIPVARVIKNKRKRNVEVTSLIKLFDNRGKPLPAVVSKIT